MTDQTPYDSSAPGSGPPAPRPASFDQPAPPSQPYSQGQAQAPGGYPQPGYAPGPSQPAYPPPGYGPPPAYGPPAYGPPPPGYPGYPVQPPLNTYAILGLILAIFVLPPLGIYFGTKAQQQIAVTGERGVELAKAAVVVGWVLSILFAVLFLIWCAFAVSIFSGLFGAAALSN